MTQRFSLPGRKARCAACSVVMYSNSGSAAVACKALGLTVEEPRARLQVLLATLEREWLLMKRNRCMQPLGSPFFTSHIGAQYPGPQRTQILLRCCTM